MLSTLQWLPRGSRRKTSWRSFAAWAATEARGSCFLAPSPLPTSPTSSKPRPNSKCVARQEDLNPRTRIPSPRPQRPRPPEAGHWGGLSLSAVLGLEAERLGDEDDVDATRRLVVDDQCLR